jgi:hypothetical protein
MGIIPSVSHEEISYIIWNRQDVVVLPEKKISSG